MDIITMLDEMGAIPFTLALMGAGIILGIFLYIRSLKHKQGLPAEEETLTGKEAEYSKWLESIQPSGEDDKKSPMGQGASPCYVIRKNGVFEKSTISEPLGHAFIADPSMSRYGLTGACSLVVETGDAVVSYDPRQEAYIADESPFHAWLAIHWDIVKEVFKTARPWWQSAPLWVTMLVLALLFISMLVFGGG